MTSDILRLTQGNGKAVLVAGEEIVALQESLHKGVGCYVLLRGNHTIEVRDTAESIYKKIARDYGVDDR